jgi:hypothetical protein
LTLLQDIQATLDRLLEDSTTTIQLFEDDSDNYDSDGLPEDIEISSEPAETAWEWDEPTQSAAPSQYPSEAEALKSIQKDFTYGDYHPGQFQQLGEQLLDFLITTMQKDSHHALDHELLSFLAIHSMDFDTQSFKSPGLVGQGHSALIYYFQLMIIEHSSLDVPNRARQIQSFMEDYFHNHAYSALADLLAQRVLALDISKKSSGAYNDVVPLPGQKISFQKITISIPELGSFFQRLVGMATTILADHLLIRPIWWQAIRGQLSLQQASPYENIQNRKAYWNCLVPNPILQKLGSFIYEKIAADVELCPQWFHPMRRPRESLMSQYFDHLQDFQRILMILLYGTSGGPPRGSEVPPILHANTPQAVRTLFLDRRHHLYLLRLRYSKTASRTRLEQQAIRVLPESVSFLILAYLALVQPFIQFLNIMETGHYSRGRELLFFHRTELISERLLGQSLKSYSQLILGKMINLWSFRQIMQGFIRYYMDQDCEDPWAGHHGESNRFFLFEETLIQP